MAALTVIAFAIVALVLSRDRKEVPWAVLMTGFGVLALLTIHELAPAALVAAAVAGLAGQRWYRNTYPQEYTTKPSEVLFSRGGRAATVFSLALLGFLIVADRLPTRTAVGSGFTPDLQTTIDSMEDQLAELPEDARILHTRADHGDLLIWHGRKSYVDSRITPFGVPDAEGSISHQYNALRTDVVLSSRQFQDAVNQQQATQRAAMQQAAQDSAATGDTSPLTMPESAPILPSDLDKSVNDRLSELGVTHVLVRLSPPGPPDYATMGALIGNRRDWTITALGPSSAVFAFTNTTGGDDDRSIQTLDTRKVAFEGVERSEMTRFEFAREPGFYDRYLYRTRPHLSADLRLAQHYLQLAPGPASLMVAIRAASRVVARDPQSAEGYYALGKAYSALAEWEYQTAQQIGGTAPTNFRYIQSVTALRQAVKIRPDLMDAWGQLFQNYLRQGRMDLARECIEHVMPQLEKAADTTDDPAAEQRLQQQLDMRDQLAERVSDIEIQVDQALQQTFSEVPAENGTQKLQLAQQAATAGHVSRALQILNDSMDVIEQDPNNYAPAEILRAQLLLESGSAEEAFDLYSKLNILASENKMPPGAAPWTMMWAIAATGRGDYETSAMELSTVIDHLNANDSNPMVIGATLATLPLVAPVETAARSTLTMKWPFAHLGVVRTTMMNVREQQAHPAVPAGDDLSGMGRSRESPQHTGKSDFRMWIDVLAATGFGLPESSE